MNTMERKLKNGTSCMWAWVQEGTDPAKERRMTRLTIPIRAQRVKLLRIYLLFAVLVALVHVGMVESVIPKWNCPKLAIRASTSPSSAPAVASLQAIRGLTASLGSMWRSVFSRRVRTNVVMLGLDSAGKTAVLYKLRLGQAVQTIPTMGFNTESIPYKKFEFRIWDVGGQDRIRSLWQHHLDGAKVVIFVVDAADRTRIPKAANELHKLMQDPRLSDAHLLVYANKQDQDGAMTVT